MMKNLIQIENKKMNKFPKIKIPSKKWYEDYVNC